MKMYIKKLSNKLGKEYFKGEKANLIQIRDTKNQHGAVHNYNLIGDFSCFDINNEVQLYSATTQKWINIGYITKIENNVIDENTKGQFIVIK